MPLLQAEEDRDQARRYYADKAREKELLGTDAKIYNSDRYVFLYNCVWDDVNWAREMLIMFMEIQLRPPYLHLYPQQGHSISAWKIIKFCVHSIMLSSVCPDRSLFGTASVLRMI